MCRAFGVHFFGPPCIYLLSGLLVVCLVGWSVGSFANLAVISRTKQVRFSVNLAQKLMSSSCAKFHCLVLRGRGQSSRSKPPYWNLQIIVRPYIWDNLQQIWQSDRFWDTGSDFNMKYDYGQNSRWPSCGCLHSLSASYKLLFWPAAPNLLRRPRYVFIAVFFSIFIAITLCVHCVRFYNKQAGRRSAPSPNAVAMATRVGPQHFAWFRWIGHPRKPPGRCKRLRSIWHTSRFVGDFVKI